MSRNAERLLVAQVLDTTRDASPSSRDRAPMPRFPLAAVLAWLALAFAVMAVLAALAIPANAAVIAEQQNKAGGMLRLLDDRSEKCGPKERVAITSLSGGGSTTFGCWAIVSGLVMIRWLDDNTITTLEIAGFRLVETASDGDLSL